MNTRYRITRKIDDGVTQITTISNDEFIILSLFKLIFGIILLPIKLFVFLPITLGWKLIVLTFNAFIWVVTLPFKIIFSLFKH